MAQAPAATIYVLNGPNLNLSGTREPETYGHATLADVEKLCVETAAQFGLAADCRQSNREGELIDFIHEARAKKAVGTNIHARETFRHHSYTARAAFASLCGFGIDGYRRAINGLAAKIGVKAKS